MEIELNSVDPDLEEWICHGLEKGVREFNAEDFFECHDTLEELWMGVRGEARLFLQGLIQTSIGYYHLTCENWPGAEHLLTRGVEKLKTYGLEYRGLDLADLIRRVISTLEEVVAIRSGEREAPSVDTIPKILGRVDSP